MRDKAFDIIVVGGGHAGAEAAWTGARMGLQVALITLDAAKVGAMSCNPAIGGLAKGQMVREVDALGGLMGRAIDATGIQFRMLNRSKGPAVWGPRAQGDKYKYAAEVQRLLSTQPNISTVEGEAVDVETEPSGSRGELRVIAVRLADGRRLACACAILTTGTFLRALMHTGLAKTTGGRVGEAAANSMSDCLKRLGFELGRLKTGTPPRLHVDSIDFSKFTVQPGDDQPLPFAHINESDPAWKPPLRQVPCFLGHTTPAAHDIIRANLHLAPMYSGQIEGTGPRYCPSIEDKVVRFADKSGHQLFLEPEGLDTNEIYVNGISTSLPAEVQRGVLDNIPGLEKAEVLRWGYAVEYDMVWPHQIESTLQTKRITGLFLAGQINGTSGYEEAAAQGQVAGINAARMIASGGQRAGADFILGRDEAYTGVLIDDLVTRPPTEPYRMFTSRAEHRLYLRNDNADARLTNRGRALGLVDDKQWAIHQATLTAIASATDLLATGRVEGVSATEWLRRPDNVWAGLVSHMPALSSVSAHAAIKLEVAIKYEGYVRRQGDEIERMNRLESKLIPPTLDYAAVPGLRNEARQKLTTFTPRSLGQASRISGITPADLTVLAIWMRRAESSPAV